MSNEQSIAEGEAAGGEAGFLGPDLTVLELGERIAAGATGSLLAQLGCRVIQVEPPGETCPDATRPRVTRPRDKWSVRAQFAGGKHNIALDPEIRADRELAQRLALAADLVITSRDLDRFAVSVDTSTQVHCDITAFGQTGPLAGRAYSDSQIQALTGMLDTTGPANGPPVLVGGDAVEFTTAIYAAAASAAALRVRRLGGGGQSVDMALFDCGLSAVSTFLPRYFQDPAAPIRRAGNRHPLTGPWNVFSASDGWVLICTANDAQWQRLCAILERPDLAAAEQFKTTAQRMERMADIDIHINAWTGQRSVADCVAAFAGTSVASGPIAPMNRYPCEANLDHRGMIRCLREPGATSSHSGARSEDVYVPASPIRAAHGRVVEAGGIPAADDGRAVVLAWLRSVAQATTQAAAQAAVQAAAQTAGADGAPLPAPPPLPLTGIRVIEIGHYTTAPLSARHLASLGAGVIKLEPPGGEGMRAWPPAQAGQGIFFTYTNADKRSLTLDLNSDGGAAIFAALIRDSDVLVENLKPGALDKRGLGWSRLRELNPRLVYCAISGFGEDTLYQGRAAFDTVIQAMCGLMSINLADGVPVKAGVSSADLMGAELCVLNVLAALEARDRTGRGDYFDLAMQDVAAWATQTSWNRDPAARATPRIRTLACADGLVMIEAEPNPATAEVLTGVPAALSREELARRVNAAGGVAAPVLTVNEAAAHPQTAARKLLFRRTDYRGIEWPMMSSPLRLGVTAPRTEEPMEELGRHSEEIARAAGFDPDDAAVRAAVRTR